MDVTVRIPDDLAQRLGSVGELERRALEALALEEYKLGHPASYGCVRMSSRDVMWLYDQVGAGARVDILREPLPPPDQLPR